MLFARCAGVPASDLVVQYVDWYEGAQSLCAPPQSTCPSTQTCGRYGAIASCGTCPSGQACAQAGTAAGCVATTCP